MVTRWYKIIVEIHEVHDDHVLVKTPSEFCIIDDNKNIRLKEILRLAEAESKPLKKITLEAITKR